MGIGLLVSAVGVVWAQPPAGSVVAWGDNDFGQCNIPSPNSGFVAIAAAAWHSLGLKIDGSVVAWGDNRYGQLGIPQPNSGFTAIAAGEHYSLGLKADGSVVKWGSVDSLPSENKGFVAISTNGWHHLGLKSNGSIMAWGNNDSGQSNVPEPNTDFVAIAAGEKHSLGLKKDGSIVAWGKNSKGQCNVPAPNSDFVAIGAGYEHSLGLKNDGSIVAWGRNDYGQCNVPNPNEGFVTISAGQWHNLALKADGSIVAWGSNSDDRCDVPSPNTGYVAISAGAFHSLAISQRDLDGDGIPNETDNCPEFPSQNQYDRDSDGIGDVCDPDIDGDDIFNAVDNCPWVYNPGQEDQDGDGIGDVCHAMRVPDDYPTIQAAVDAAGSGDTILLAPGVYTGWENRGITINKPLTIRGLGGPEQCILDCEEGGRGFSVVLEDANAEVVFEGLTVTNGWVNLFEGSIFGGGAVLLSGHGKARLSDCIIRGNRAIGFGYGYSGYGGGISCYGYWQLFIRNCIVQNNIAEGGPGSDCLDIPSGDAFGGGIYCQAGDMDIRDSSLIGNLSLGGFVNWGECGPMQFGRGYGGGICSGNGRANMVLDHCLVVGNNVCTCHTAYPAYGTGLAGGAGTIRNCTFCTPYHPATEGYSGIWDFAGDITNSIFQDSDIVSPNAQVSYCLTTHSIAGTGNITSDPNTPIFADPGYWDRRGLGWIGDDVFVPGDYHLKSQDGRWDPTLKIWVKDTVTIPCIDAGDPADEGWKQELWPNGRRINMGAYGGTAEASMSADAIGMAADLNFDDAVDFADLLEFARYWTKHEVLLSADIDRNGRVGIEDLAIVAENWMK